MSSIDYVNDLYRWCYRYLNKIVYVTSYVSDLYRKYYELLIKYGKR